MENMDMKKILVTGHCGYIGSLLTKMLLQQGYPVTGLDTVFFDSECELFPPDGEFRAIKKDIREVAEKDLEGVYAICHLAALSNDPMGAMDPELTRNINHKASVRLAKLAKKAGVERFIFSSSCSMYGISDGSQALTEDAPFNPVTAYAKSKVDSEHDILPLGDESFCVTFLRNTTAFGTSPKLRVDLVVNNLVGWAVTTGEIRIMSDGTPWRPLIHAEDIARAFIAVTEAPQSTVNRQAFKTGINEENYRVREIAETVGAVIPGCRINITGEHGNDSRSYRVDFTRIKTALPGFRPQWNLRKGVEDIYDNYLRYNMDWERFNGRYFVRLKQLQHLLHMGYVSNELYWL